MPGRDYYLAPDKEMQANRAAYQAYVQKLLELSGTPDAAAKAKSIFDLETKIANAQSGLVDSEDVHKANNPWAAADWAKKAPGIDWPVFFEGAGLKGQPIVFAWQPEAIAKLSKLVASEPLQTWKDYLRFHEINHGAGLLPKAYADAAFGFYGKQLSGTPKQQDRWKRGIAATNNDLGDAVGKIYVDRFFPASSKAQVQDMPLSTLSQQRTGSPSGACSSIASCVAWCTTVSTLRRRNWGRSSAASKPDNNTIGCESPAARRRSASLNAATPKASAPCSARATRSRP